MFDVGFTELVVIFVVALLVVGPERLPSVARKAGLYLGKIRRSFQSIKDEVEQELEIEAVKAKLKEQAMLDEAKELQQELNQTIHPDASSDSKSTASDSSKPGTSKA